MTSRQRDRIVIECIEDDEDRLPPGYLHRLDYQTGVLRFEYDNKPSTLVSLVICGMFIPEGLK